MLNYMAQKVVDSKNLVTIGKTIGKKFERVDNLLGKVAKNKGIIDTLDTVGDAVNGIFGGVTDIARLAQDPISTPWKPLRMLLTRYLSLAILCI
jgi:hypothetical protein